MGALLTAVVGLAMVGLLLTGVALVAYTLFTCPDIHDVFEEEAE